MPNYIYAVGRRRRKNNSYTYTLSSSTNSPIEGQTINFTVNTTAPNGKIVFYSIEHILTSGVDFTGSTSGSVTIASGSATFSIVVNNDVLIENGETFKVALFTGSANGRRVAESSTITIEASDIGYSIVPSTLSVDEPGTVNFVVTARGLANGTPLYYDVEHIDTDSADFTGATSGTITIMSETASFGISTVADVLTEGPQKFRARVRTDSASGTVVVQSADITIADTSASPQTYTIAPNPVITSTDEGTTVTFSIVTTNVFNGTTLYYDIEHISTAAADFTTATSGTVSIQSNAASFNVSVKADLTTEGAQTFKARLRTVSASGTVVASSEIITVNDTSYGYLLTSNVDTVNEGQTVRFTITTSGLSDGATVPYTITGNGVFAGDIVESLNGNFVITGNSGSVDITAVIDVSNESAEVMTMSAGGASKSVTILNIAAPTTTYNVQYRNLDMAKPNQGITRIDRRGTRSAGYLYAYVHDESQKSIDVFKVTNNGAFRSTVSDPTLRLSTADRNALFGTFSANMIFDICGGYMPIGSRNLNKIYIFRNSSLDWASSYSTISITGGVYSMSMTLIGTTQRLAVFDESGIRVFQKTTTQTNFTEIFTHSAPYGGHVFLTANGNYLAATIANAPGGTSSAEVRVWDNSNGTTWTQKGTTRNNALIPMFFDPVAGNLGMDNSGSVLVYTIPGTNPNPAQGRKHNMLQYKNGDWVKSNQETLVNSILGTRDCIHINSSGSVIAIGEFIFRKISDYLYKSATLPVNDPLNCTHMNDDGTVFVISDGAYSTSEKGDIAVYQLTHT